MPEPAELLFVADHLPGTGRGGIWTGTGDETDAVAVHRGRIVALGQEARERRGARTEVVELGGRTLLPGFRDGHLHPLNGGAETLDCDLVDAADVDEVLGRLRSYATSQPDVPWVLGWGYPPEILPAGTGRATVLDAVVADRPVALWSSDHHMVWCNTRALEVAGIGRGTPDPPRGTIVREPDGTPVGTLLEEAELLLEPHLPPRGLAKEMRGLEVGLHRMTSTGIVWGQDAWVVPDQVAAYLRVAGEGRLTAGLDLACKVEVDHWRAQVAVFEDLRAEVAAAARQRVADGVPGGRLTATTVKIFVDGVIEAGTAALLDPYEPGFGGAHACGDDHGIANWEAGELAEAAAAMDAAGFQLHMHAIGDAAIRMALDTVAAVVERNGPRDRRPVVAHTHLVHPADLPRFRALGVIANLEPLWAQRNEIMLDLTEPRLGPERSRWQYPIRSLLDAGARVSFGSDWPVSSQAPLEGLAVAVSRRGRIGPGAREPFLPEQAIELGEALRAYTAGTADQAGDGAAAGTISVGAGADLVLAGADVVALPTEELPAVPVEATWVGGALVHGQPPDGAPGGG